MRKTAKQLDADIAEALDPFAALDKRARLALRHAFTSTDGMASAPSAVVRKLERGGLIIRTGSVFESQEWGKVVRRDPVFFLTDKGRAAATTIMKKLYGSTDGKL